MNLTSNEQMIVSTILSRCAPELVYQLDGIKVIERRHNGAGMNLEFETEKAPLEDSRSGFIGSGFFLEVENCSDVFQIVLMARGGRLVGLEAWNSSRAVFPEDMEQFKVPVYDP
jgi:hypothetical protein